MFAAGEPVIAVGTWFDVICSDSTAYRAPNREAYAAAVMPQLPFGRALDGDGEVIAAPTGADPGAGEKVPELDGAGKSVTIWERRCRLPAVHR
jgi:hypothetical protein